jgi:Uma2 family endonuclease
MSSAEIINKPRPRVTVEQYLALERAAPERSEYFDGTIIAMAGESPEHGLVAFNLVTTLGSQLIDKPCVGFTKDTKVRSGLGVVSTDSASGIFSYPDLVFVCGEREYFDEHRDVLTNPTAIIEVLSPSTENFDRGEKVHRYSTWNPTLQDYLLVAQDKPQVDHYHREKDGKWTWELHVGLKATFAIPSIQCVLKLADVYRNVDLGDKTVKAP